MQVCGNGPGSSEERHPGSLRISGSRLWLDGSADVPTGKLRDTVVAVNPCVACGCSVLRLNSSPVDYIRKQKYQMYIIP